MFLASVAGTTPHQGGEQVQRGLRYLLRVPGQQDHGRAERRGPQSPDSLASQENGQESFKRLSLSSALHPQRRSLLILHCVLHIIMVAICLHTSKAGEAGGSTDGRQGEENGKGEERRTVGRGWEGRGAGWECERVVWFWCGFFVFLYAYYVFCFFRNSCVNYFL